MEEINGQARFLSKVQKQYDLYKEMFKDCAANISQFFSQNSQIKDVVIDVNFDDNYFDLKFLDIVLRFTYSIVVVDGDLIRGCVKCKVTDETSKRNFDKVVGITFFGSYGDTDIRSGDGDPIYLNDSYGSRFLAVHFLYKAIQEIKTTKRNSLVE